MGKVKVQFWDESFLSSYLSLWITSELYVYMQCKTENTLWKEVLAKS